LIIRKTNLILVFLSVFITFLTVFSTVSVTADQAGVGVLNVNPKFGHIKIEQKADTIRLYLNISDYNSWGDLFKVKIELKDKENDELIASFLYKQYENEEKWEKIHVFQQTHGEPLLLKEKCSVGYSNKKLTVDQRCDLGLLFVFNKTWFTSLNVFISDREGSKDASAEIDYIPVVSKPETGRSNNFLFIPWLDSSFLFEVPDYFPSLLALLLGIMGALLCVKKRKDIWMLKRNSYGKG